VHDRVFTNGDLTEDTFDWYATDKDGNVWYFGEDSKTLEDGKVISTEGSWEAGKDGAKPGIIMEAHPKVGDVYRQEFAPEVAQDMAKVLSLNASVTVPYGSFTGCLQTEEWSALDPEVRENKFYCLNIGDTKELDVRGGNEVLVLTTLVQR
jgi:hypothetical protein